MKKNLSEISHLTKDVLIQTRLLKEGRGSTTALSNIAFELYMKAKELDSMPRKQKKEKTHLHAVTCDLTDDDGPISPLGFRDA